MNSRQHDLLILIGRPLGDSERKAMDKLLRPAPDNQIAASCYITHEAWAARTTKAPKNILDELLDLLGKLTPVVVAPLAGDWTCQNSKSALECFRNPDDLG
jgi:hypothetical protein